MDFVTQISPLNYRLAVNDIHSNSNAAVLDLTGDTADMMKAQKKVDRKWDSTKKKYVASNNKEKMIKSESGQWIPVSYKSDKYAKWQEKSKVRNAENSDDEEEAVKPLPGKMIRVYFYEKLFII